MKTIVIDLDNTLTIESDDEYIDKPVNLEVLDALRKYKQQGFSITISTARQMRTYQANIGKINAFTLPTIIDWLDRHDVPYDEIHVGKPWCGYEGFYVDDKAIRPSEFVKLSFEEIEALLNKEAAHIGGQQ